MVSVSLGETQIVPVIMAFLLEYAFCAAQKLLTKSAMMINCIVFICIVLSGVLNNATQRNLVLWNGENVFITAWLKYVVVCTKYSL